MLLLFQPPSSQAMTGATLPLHFTFSPTRTCSLGLCGTLTCCRGCKALLEQVLAVWELGGQVLQAPLDAMQLLRSPRQLTG